MANPATNSRMYLGSGSPMIRKMIDNSRIKTARSQPMVNTAERYRLHVTSPRCMEEPLPGGCSRLGS